MAEAVNYKIERKEYDPRSWFMRIMAPNLRQTSIEITEGPRLSFRVKEIDDEGNPSGYTTVVSSASSQNQLPDSFIVDGDEVRVSGTIDDELMEADELTNLRTGMTVRLQRRGGLLRWLAGNLFWLVAAVLLAYILLAIL